MNINILNKRIALAAIGMICLVAACSKKAVIVPKDARNAITSFSIGGIALVDTIVTTVPDSAKVVIYVKWGTDLSAIAPVIKTSDKATVSPASGAIINFAANNNKYTYVVTAESGAVKKWYVEIRIYIPPKPDLSKYVANPQPDTVFQKYFTRYSGWNSGDGAQSILLQDGRVVWLFGDSFVGDVNPDRTRVSSNNYLINNVMMVQQGSTFTSFYGTTQAGKPAALFIPADPTHFYWTRHGFVDNNKLYITLMELANIKTGNTTNTVHLADKVAVLSLPDLKFQKLIDIPYHNAISYGDRPFTDGGYHYIFGTGGDGWATLLYMARVKVGHAEEPWEFYTNNDQWVTDMSKAIPITIPGNVTQPTVVNRNGRYYLFTQQNFFSKNILMLRADKPEGPYTDEKVIYTEPETISSYLALGHPEFIQNNTLLIGYSLGGDIFASFKNVDIEVPRFIRVNLPE